MAFDRVIILTLLLIVSHLSIRNAKAVENSELIRASIIEKVATFIEWPSSSKPQFNLCVFENTPLLTALETYYSHSSPNQKPINLVTFKNLTQTSNCDIIYLSDEETNNLGKLLDSISDQPILIISEKEDAVNEGAHIDFFVEQNRLHLEVNRKALSDSRLTASYHLLGVARIVE